MEPAQPQLSGFCVCVIRRYIRLKVIGLLAVAALGLSGCASLPDAAEDRAVPHAEQVEFEGAKGAVSVARSDAIIVQLEGKDTGTDVLQKHLAYEQAVNINSPLVLGNKLTLLQNGPDTYQAMYVAIRAATDSINLETYIINDDVIGNHFSDLLLERQSAGVQVNVIYDSFGSMMTSTAFFDRLRDGGVNVLQFNPLNPTVGNTEKWALNNRDHRKQMIVDGRVVFTGGVNISETYSSTPLGLLAGKIRKRPEGENTSWRDTHIQIEGPVVAEFQKLFMETWTRQNGEPLAARNYFPELKAEGDEIVRAIGSTPTDPASPIYLTLMSAISHAEYKIHITIAYFAPDPQLLKALIDAAQRGVDVKLILPSYSDSQAIFHLGRSHYTELLRGGVKIYERRGAMMHVKSVSIDDVWTTIGSTNLDMRSFLHNDEINAVILGRDFATQMENIFAGDLKESEQILLEKWQRRSLLLRFKENAARLGEYWL
jgi:cardiolipin synthase